MNTEQLDMFAADEAKQGRIKRVQEHIESWRICWNWEGPKVGALCEVGMPIVSKDDGGTVYAYTEICRITRIEGNMVYATIEMPEPWEKNGTRLRLDITEVWPPVRILTQQPHATSPARINDERRLT